MIIKTHTVAKNQVTLSMSIDDALALISTLSEQVRRTITNPSGMDSWEQTTAPIREFRKKYDWKDYPGVLVTHVETKK